MQTTMNYSPCLTCTSVRDPGNCENKNCARWRNWFISRWDQLRTVPRMQMEQQEPKPDGIRIGGVPYVLPHRVREYLGADPCEKCLCKNGLCTSPCPTRRAWDQAKNEVVQ